MWKVQRLSKARQVTEVSRVGEIRNGGILVKLKYNRDILVDKTLEEAIVLANRWFSENEIAIPRIAKDWRGVGVHIPEGFSITVIKRVYNLSVKQWHTLLTSKEYVAKGNFNPVTTYSEMNTLGLELLSKNQKNIRFKCNKCNRTDTTDYETLSRWRSRGVKFCAICRGSSGKVKPLEFYKAKFKDVLLTSNLSLLSGDAKTLLVECNDCQTKFTRTQSHAIEARELLCPTCYPIKGFGFRSKFEDTWFDSKRELDVYKALRETLGKDEIQTHLKYREIFTSISEEQGRKICDFYLPKYKTIIEVTYEMYNSAHPEYKRKMDEKLSLSGREGLTVLLVTELEQVYDIVRGITDNSR